MVQPKQIMNIVPYQDVLWLAEIEEPKKEYEGDTILFLRFLFLWYYNLTYRWHPFLQDGLKSFSHYCKLGLPLSKFVSRSLWFPPETVHLLHNIFLIQFQQRCFTWTRSPWSHLQVTSWPSRAPSKLDLYIFTPGLSPPSWLPSPVLVIASPQPRGERGPQVTYIFFKYVIKLNPYPVSALFPYSHRCEF